MSRETPPISFSGGSGGIDAQYAAMEHLATTYLSTADQAAAWSSAALATTVDATLLGSAAYAPVTFATVEAGLLALTAGRNSLAANAGSWGLQAEAVRRSAALLEEADATVAAVLGGGQFVAGYALGFGAGTLLRRAGLGEYLPEPGDDLGPLVGAASSGGGAGGAGDAFEEWAVANPDHFELLLGGGGGALEGLWDSGFAATPGFGRWALPTMAAAAGALALFYEQGTPVVEQVGPTVRRAGADGLAALVGELDRVNQLGDGAIEIRRTGDGPDASFVVLLPGTDDLGTLPGQQDTDVRDAGTNFASMAGDPTAYAAGIAEAMRAAGISADSPVTLVGHSQGGMAAVQLAASGEFAVEEVVTLGSPIALMPEVPDGVQITALENHSDLIPRLDGRANPDRDDLLTVGFDVDGHSASSAHAIEAYQRAAEAFDDSAHRSAQQRVEGLQDAGAVGQETVSATTYRVTRELP